MRGEVIQYSGGSGLISGDDGARYSFTDEQVGEGVKLGLGSRVDFVVTDGTPSEIYTMPGSPEPIETTNEDLSVWEYFKKCMRLYADGNGRARRKEYWSFVLFSWLLMIAGAFVLIFLSAFITGLADLTGDESAMGGMSVWHWLIVLMVLVALIAFLIPSFAVLSRRLHDIGMNGWFALLSLIPYLGGFFVLVVALIPSQMAKNQYGRYPKPLPRL